MAENKEPNLILAEMIAFELKAKNLILNTNEASLIKLLAEGKMKDTSWKKLFENKINFVPTSDET